MTTQDLIAAHKRVIGHYQTAEWSDRRNGCQLSPDDLPAEFSCCPSCYGIEPSQSGGVRDFFPESALGHRYSCELKRTLDVLIADLGSLMQQGQT